MGGGALSPRGININMDREDHISISHTATEMEKARWYITGGFWYMGGNQSYMQEFLEEM